MNKSCYGDNLYIYLEPIKTYRLLDLKKLLNIVSNKTHFLRPYFFKYSACTNIKSNFRCLAFATFSFSISFSFLSRTQRKVNVPWSNLSYS